MKMTLENYQHVAGGRGVRGSLWAAEDHLLYIDSAGFILPFIERYRRFDWDRIESLTVARSKAGLVWNIVWACLLAFCLILALLSFTGTSVVGAAIMVVFALITLGLLLNNVFRGPTCRLNLTTAVGVHTLSPVYRWRKAPAIVEFLDGRIAEAQKEAELSTGSTGGDGGAVDLEQLLASGNAAMPLPVQMDKTAWTGRLFAVLAGLTGSLAGGLFIGEFTIDSPAYTSVLILLGLAAFALSLLALAKALRRATPVGLVPTLIVGVGALIVDAAIAYAVFIRSTLEESMESGAGFTDVATIISNLSTLSSDGLGIFYPIAMGAAVVTLITSLLVLILSLVGGRPKAGGTGTPDGGITASGEDGLGH